MRAILCILLATVVQQLPPRDRPATAPTAGAVVSGRVYAEATGSPIQGALVARAQDTDQLQVAKPGEAFFDLLSREATPFVIGDDERRTLELRLWRWPE